MGLLKSLGFVRRQIALSVSWQTTTVAAIGIVLGVPLGIAAGRLVWDAFASNLGVVAVSVVTAWVVVAIAVETWWWRISWRLGRHWWHRGPGQRHCSSPSERQRGGRPLYGHASSAGEHRASDDWVD